MPHEGELAALATAVCWAGSSIFFHAAGRRIGALAVNQVRIVLAVGLLLLAHLALTGTLWPAEATPGQYGLLAGSGVIGLVLGDTFFFASLVQVGPKLATLLMTLAPLLAALLARWALGEALGPYAHAGMAVTMAGVALAVLGRRGGSTSPQRRNLWLGILFGVLAAAGQGVGIVLAKRALSDFSALSGTLLRMTAAMLVLVAVGAVQAATRREGRERLARTLRNGPAIGFTAAGAFFGSFVGIWLSLFAVKHAEVGVASTLMATVPIVVIPQTWLLRGERPTWLEVLGAVAAVVGVFLLFQRDGVIR